MSLPKLRCKQHHVTNSVIQILFNSNGVGGGDGGREQGRERKRENTVTITWYPVASCQPFFFLLSGGGPQRYQTFWRYHFYTVWVLAIQRGTCCYHNLEWHMCKKSFPIVYHDGSYCLYRLFRFASPGLASTICCINAFLMVCTRKSSLVC